MQAAPDTDARARILAEATRLFATRGYGSTSVREVVEAAGVTKPVLYYYFGSKEGLFLEAVHTHLRGFTDLVKQATEGPGTVRERLRAFVDACVRGAQRQPEVVRLLVTAQHRPEKGQPEVDLMSVHLQNSELLAALLAEGVRAGEIRADLDLPGAVLSLVGMVNMHSMAVCHGGPLPPDFPDGLLGLFFEGASPR